MDFVIDTSGDANIDDPSSYAQENSGPSPIITQLLKEFKTSLEAKSKAQKPAPKKLSEDELASKSILESLGWKDKLNPKNSKKKKPKDTFSNIKEKELSEEVRKALDKSIVLKPEFASLHDIPRYDVSQKKLLQERKKERGKTKGIKWYGLPATEMTEDVKKDLEIIQMRSVLDPKRFYKKNDLNVLPKYFQIGKVLDSPVEFYSNRMTKKERKATLVDELMADAEFHKYNKRKYKEIIEDKQKTHYKAWRQAKRLKKKK